MAKAFHSAIMPFTSPVSILALSQFSSTSLPVVVAQVGLQMTGRTFQLFTFDATSIVAVKMTFPADGLKDLSGGGAASHGAGLVCAHANGQFQLTQMFWSGPGPRESIHSVRWVLQGQPLRQVSVKMMASSTTSYARAAKIDSEDCSG